MIVSTWVGLKGQVVIEVRYLTGDPPTAAIVADVTVRHLRA